MRVKKWLYINLSHRPDRDAHIRSELTSAGIPESQIQRVEAIKHQRGDYGCSQSHVKAMQLGIRSGVDCFAVLEDDFTIRDRGTFLTQIEAAPQFDVFIGSLGKLQLKTVPYGPTYCRVLQNQTTPCYVVTSEYAPILLGNFLESVKLFSTYNYNYAIDQYWKRLQPNALWISILPSPGYQMEDFSDIEKKNVNYEAQFDWETHIKTFIFG